MKKSTELQKKMVALAVMSSMKTILSNHLYSFNKKLYRQRSGGPIGENITNLAAELCMYEFIQGYRKVLHKLEINDTIKFMKVYVDDLNQRAFDGLTDLI